MSGKGPFFTGHQGDVLPQTRWVVCGAVASPMVARPATASVLVGTDLENVVQDRVQADCPLLLSLTTRGFALALVDSGGLVCLLLGDGPPEPRSPPTKRGSRSPLGWCR